MEEKIEIVTEEMRINDVLFYKMQHEQDRYIKQVENLPPHQIISLATEIVLRTALLKTMEKHDLSQNAATGLYRLDNPLSFLSTCYKEYPYYSFQEFLQIIGDALFQRIPQPSD